VATKFAVISVWGVGFIDWLDGQAGFWRVTSAQLVAEFCERIVAGNRIELMKTTIAVLILFGSSISIATAKVAQRWPVSPHPPPAHHPLFVLVDGRWVPWIDGEF
jgi:hypothetical protein